MFWKIQMKMLDENDNVLAFENAESFKFDWKSALRVNPISFESKNHTVDWKKISFVI